jgi:hypothetical protein
LRKQNAKGEDEPSIALSQLTSGGERSEGKPRLGGEDVVSAQIVRLSALGKNRDICAQTRKRAFASKQVYSYVHVEQRKPFDEPSIAQAQLPSGGE